MKLRCSGANAKARATGPLCWARELAKGLGAERQDCQFLQGQLNFQDLRERLAGQFGSLDGYWAARRANLQCYEQAHSDSGSYIHFRVPSFEARNMDADVLLTGVKEKGCFAVHIGDGNGFKLTRWISDLYVRAGNRRPDGICDLDADLVFWYRMCTQ